ncbi:hypothetical protein, partial [Candidatus Ichthyocystis sparus]|uniref:hypothetical protein n=1 Tax=Candidatus Ichthyocystis sparus TaxID=1561004 RepID=UPI00114688FA
MISKSKSSGSGDKAAGEGIVSGSGIVAVSPDNAGSSSPVVAETAPQVRIIRVISKSKASGSGINITNAAASGGGGVVLSPDGTKSSLPPITGSVPQTRVIRSISKNETSGSGSSGKATSDDIVSGSGIVAASPDNAESSLPIVTETVPQVRVVRVICKRKTLGSGINVTSDAVSSGGGVVVVSPDGTKSSLPSITGSVPQTRAISESKISGSGSEATGEGTTLGGGIVVASPDGAGSSLPPVTETVIQRCVISESNISGDSSKCAEGTESGSSAIDLTSRLVVSLPRLKFQHELSSQPESSLSPVDTVPRRRLISEGNISGGSSKCAEGTESVSSTAALTNSPVISSTQLRSELSSQSETQLRSLLLLEGKYDRLSPRFVKSLSYRDRSANLYDIASTSDGPPSNYSDFGALVGELSPAPSSPPSISFAPLSPSASEPEPQSQYEMQLGSLSGERFSRISADGSVSTLESDASDLRVLEDGSSSSESGSASSSESGSASGLYEDFHSAFVTQLVMEYLEASTSGSVVAVSSSPSVSAPAPAPASELLVASDISPSLSPLAESLAMPTVSDQSGSVSVTDIISTSIALPSVESSLSVAVPTLSVGSFLSISDDVLVPTAEGVASALMGAGDDSLSPPSSPSILPLSSSLSSSSSSLSLCASGLDADVSSSSTESSVLGR